jgi:hypothetical protein
MLKHRTQSTALVPIDDDVDNLPFIVRRDHRIVAGFAPEGSGDRRGPRCARGTTRAASPSTLRGGCDRCLLGRSTARRMPLNHGR